MQLSAGLLDSAKQATKATVLSWMPRPAPDASTVSFSSRLDDVGLALDTDPAPLDLLRRMPERYLFEGVPRVHEIVHPGQGIAGEEFAADILAFRWILEACGPLDRMMPNMATQGAFFVVTAIEVLRQARDIARHGERRVDIGSTGGSAGSDHPSNHRIWDGH